MPDDKIVDGQPPAPAFKKFDFSLENHTERAVQLGLVTLSTDLTIEAELRYFIGDSSARSKMPNIMHTRIASDDEVTPENLTAMREGFSSSLALFPSGHHFDVIGYGCTSASLLIGEKAVNELISAQIDVDHVTTPLTGARRALRALGTKKIAYLAPYVSDISANMCRFLEDDGFDIVAAGTFGESRDSVVGQIDRESILTAINRLASNALTPPDAVFVSCTALKCAPLIEAAEEKLGIPIISSNSAIAWDMARLSGLAVPPEGKGRLFHQN